MAFISAFILALGLLFSLGWYYLGPVDRQGAFEVLVIPQNDTDFSVPHTLYAQRLIRSETAYRLFAWVIGSGNSLVPGGYRVSRSMSAWAISKTLEAPPKLVWVTVREGLRKEQIGDVLATILGWTQSQQDQWNVIHNDSGEYHEGVYFPDTYLLPTDEPVEAVAKRFTDRFNEKIAPFADELLEKNIKWTTAVTFASLLEREAAGAADMPLIAGIIWNRLDADMRLDIDATLQYVKGNTSIGWWPRVMSADKFIESPYNTYQNKGLPPGPISNPGLTAIKAVLNPEKTDCIFYLHGSDRQIHCSVTYEEHKENIRKYLL